MSYFDGENARHRVHFRAREYVRQIAMYAELQIRIPADKWKAVNYFLASSNKELPLGNFESDSDARMVRFRIDLDFEIEEDTNLFLLENALNTLIKTMDTYLPAILALIYSDISSDKLRSMIDDGKNFFLNQQFCRN